MLSADVDFLESKLKATDCFNIHFYPPRTLPERLLNVLHSSSLIPSFAVQIVARAAA